MYKLKQIPEDFIVEEIFSLKLAVNGDFLIYSLKKKNCNTIYALQKISDFLHIPLKFFGFAGAKDRQAITTQFISIKKINKNTKLLLENFNSDLIELKFIGEAILPISLGDLDGNRFVIAIRNLTSKDVEKISGFKSLVLENYFDEQRFSENNPDIGLAILKNDFKKVCELADEEVIRHHLKDVPTDFVGAFKRLPLKTRLMYIHSLQSLIFNRTLAEYLMQKLKKKNNKTAASKFSKVKYSFGEFVFVDKKIFDKNFFDFRIPLIGFSNEYDGGDDGIKKIISKILTEFKITEKNFIIRPMPELSSEGGMREAFIEISNFSSEISDDELNTGKKKCIFRFFLPKGAYATLVIKSILNF